MRNVILIALLAFGCSNSATLHLRGGYRVEGVITQSSSEHLEIVHDDTGELQNISRDEVRDIDHPGNVMAAIGGGLVAVTWLTAYLSNAKSEEPRELSDVLGDAMAPYMPLGTVGLSGIFVAVGLSDWMESRWRAGDPNMRLIALSIAVTGTLLTAGGLIMAVEAGTREGYLEPGETPTYLMATGMAMLGLGPNLMVPGWIAWGRSFDNPTVVIPMMSQRDGHTVLGVALTTRW